MPRPAPLPGIRPWHLLLHSRAALGLRPGAAPALVFIPLGVLLGPGVLNVLSEDLLAHLDAVVSLALATLGVFVGLGLEVTRAQDRRVLAAGTAEALVTLAVVTGTTMFLLSRWGVPLEVPAVVLALVLGACAAVSSAGGAGVATDATHELAGRLADADDLLPICLGGVIVTLAVGQPLAAAVGLLFYTTALGLALGGAGWLLFGRPAGGAERAVFLLGTLLLLAGSAAHLGLSPLIAGLVAGMIWTVRLRTVITEDLRKIQHPVVMLLLLVGGASVEASPALAWLLVPYVLFRWVGKFAGAWCATRLLGRLSTLDVGAYLLSPGVLGIALALNFYQVTASSAGAIAVSVVALAALAGELLAAFALASPGEA